MLFLSALDAAASTSFFEKLSQVKACVNPSLTDVFSKETKGYDDQQNVTIISSQVFRDDTFPRCEKTTIVFIIRSVTGLGRIRI